MTQHAEVIREPGFRARWHIWYRHADRNFVIQLGFDPAQVHSVPAFANALLFQPRLVGLWVLTGVALDSPAVFASLALVLWWNAILPRWNPITALHNRLTAHRPGVPLVPTAPAPRRAAEAEAGTLAASITVCLLIPAPAAALGIQIFLLAAVAAVVFGRLCLGAIIYHLLRGRVELVRRSLPWNHEIV
jgi:hypothetical protein